MKFRCRHPSVFDFRRGGYGSVAIGPMLERLGNNEDTTKLMIEALRKVIKRMHYPLEITCVRRYAAYPLSLRHIEKMMAERAVFVDHATVDRWTLNIVTVLVKVFRRRKRAVANGWRMDETYIKVRGEFVSRSRVSVTLCER
jgi:hypothetical protein